MAVAREHARASNLPVVHDMINHCKLLNTIVDKSDIRVVKTEARLQYLHQDRNESARFCSLQLQKGPHASFWFDHLNRESIESGSTSNWCAMDTIICFNRLHACNGFAKVPPSRLNSTNIVEPEEYSAVPISIVCIQSILQCFIVNPGIWKIGDMYLAALHAEVNPVMVVFWRFRVAPKS